MRDAEHENAAVGAREGHIRGERRRPRHRPPTLTPPSSPSVYNHRPFSSASRYAPAYTFDHRRARTAAHWPQQRYIPAGTGCGRAPLAGTSRRRSRGYSDRSCVRVDRVAQQHAHAWTIRPPSPCKRRSAGAQTPHDTSDETGIPAAKAACRAPSQTCRLTSLTAIRPNDGQARPACLINRACHRDTAVSAHSARSSPIIIAAADHLCAGDADRDTSRPASRSAASSG